MSTGSPFLIQAADPQTHCVYFDIGSRTEMSFFTNTPCCKHLDHPCALFIFIMKPLAHQYLSQVNTPAVSDVFTTICLLISRLTILLTANYVFLIFFPHCYYYSNLTHLCTTRRKENVHPLCSCTCVGRKEKKPFAILWHYWLRVGK